MKGRKKASAGPITSRKIEARFVSLAQPFVIYTKNFRWTFVDASVLKWGQIKKHYSIYLPLICINNADAFVFTFPQRLYNMCVNESPSNVPAL